jgi:PIN domain nuclease of toxin-antitoxin system
MSQEPDLVLDASALLAYLRDEPGIDEVGRALRQRAAISSVNWAEVLSKLVDFGYDASAAGEQFRDRGLGAALTIWPFDERFARHVASLRDLTRPFGLSLGDRACLALGSFLKVPILTADHKWGELKIRVRLRFIR